MTNGESVLSGAVRMRTRLRLSIIFRSQSMPSISKLPPIHPGEVLLRDFLEPLGMTQYRLAKDIRVPPRRINQIVLGQRAITADTALRLARYFGTSAEVWIGLQGQYDLERARDELANRIEIEVMRRKIA